MGVYIVDITIPANTSQDNPISKEVVIKGEVLVRVEVRFPRGCRTLVHSICRYGQLQLYPSTKEATFHADGEVLRIPEYFELFESPMTLTIYGWSPNTRYDHTITWRFYTLPKIIAAPIKVLTKLLEGVVKLLKIMKVL